MEWLHALDGFQAYALICLLVFVEEAGLPLPFLPGDLILIAAGYLAAIHSTRLLVFLPLGYSSAVAGALCCYAISRYAGRPLVLRLGWRLGLTASRLERAERWLARAGARGIVIARILPGTRINASFAAGCLRLPPRVFIAGVVPSTVVWLGGFTLLGFTLGDSVTPVLPWVDRVIGAALVVTGAVLAYSWRRRIRRRRLERAVA
ncbi:MAG: DedA family protein [Chloroflexi bacterium]|nr:MAG: DedA family protein [Chloroflexota bacterium]